MKRIKQFLGKVYTFSKIYDFFTSISLITKLSSNKNDDLTIKLPDILHPIKLRANSSDVSTFIQVFIELSYNIKINAEPKVIIDAGANVGLSPIYFANKYPKAKIIAIEPEESNFRLLEENTKPYKNIIPIQRALSNQKEVLNVLDKGAGNWGFTTSSEKTMLSHTQKNEVTSITVPEIMEAHGVDWIDVMKIDIEGYEKELFSSNYEEWLPYCGMLVIELHDWIKLGCSKSFFSSISQYDYKYSKRGENLVFKNYITLQQSNK